VKLAAVALVAIAGLHRLSSRQFRSCGLKLQLWRSYNLRTFLHISKDEIVLGMQLCSALLISWLFRVIVLRVLAT
jgi:hypothetical protein